MLPSKVFGTIPSRMRDITIKTIQQMMADLTFIISISFTRINMKYNASIEH